MNEESLSEWKHLVKNKIEAKIHTFKAKHIRYKTNNSIMHSDSCNSFDGLYQRFKITPVCKANVNFAVTCKICYVLTLIAELGVRGNQAITYNL